MIVKTSIVYHCWRFDIHLELMVEAREHGMVLCMLVSVRVAVIETRFVGAMIDGMGEVSLVVEDGVVQQGMLNNEAVFEGREILSPLYHCESELCGLRLIGGDRQDMEMMGHDEQDSDSET